MTIVIIIIIIIIISSSSSSSSILPLPLLGLKGPFRERRISAPGSQPSAGQALQAFSILGPFTWPCDASAPAPSIGSMPYLGSGSLLLRCGSNLKWGGSPPIGERARPEPGAARGVARTVALGAS
eukprot:5693614-Pyramimonas_sp.AAC.1